MNPVGTDQCEAATYLPPHLRSELLRTHPTVDRLLVVEDLVCVLGAHSVGEHYAVLYDHFPAPVMGALWTRWDTGESPDSFWIRPDCTSFSPRRAACGHFLAHPGPHSWEAEERDGQRSAAEGGRAG
ncbi:hypothetical protein [Actinacidiphila paucisporea]|uniref:Uncharacterized protein n=1 Tax=Actinacidiphila paucisporea TaxID=310782 RepID=A0A1M6Z671_9ACTN|nr:hypothetical protein [Actinacidiphila paucisporea]SHL25917.1 hypothetical protein SAMN05216499_103232 [Actinacidiphila paucisporea]